MSVIINHIVKSFGRIQALDHVDFTVRSGELFGLIGPDGAGKSTLFRIIVSLLVPDGGSCRVNGLDVVEQFREVRKIIGYMPGRFSLYMDLTVEENLAFYANVFGTTVEANYDLISDVYQQIEPFKKRLAGKLSGGMKQKLALSCALIHRPKLLILDEPTTGVDAVSRREFWDMLKTIQAEGITIMVSTPYMDEASMCDRVALMQNGRILNISDPSLLKGDDQWPIYSLKSRQGAYSYLQKIRSLEGCKSAWLFGDALHVTLKGPAWEYNMKETIADWGDSTIVWEPIKAGIEDLFMEYMQQDMAGE